MLVSIGERNKEGCISLQGCITTQKWLYSHFSMSGTLGRTCHKTSTFWRTNTTICMEIIYQTHFLTYRQLAYLYWKEVSEIEWCRRFQLLLLLLRCLLWSGPYVTMRLWLTAPPTVLMFNWSDRVISLPYVWLYENVQLFNAKPLLFSYREQPVESYLTYIYIPCSSLDQKYFSGGLKEFKNLCIKYKPYYIFWN